MKKLIMILSFAVLVGCATTQPPAPVSHNAEQVRPENQSEEAKEAGKKAGKLLLEGGFLLLLYDMAGFF